MREKLAHGTQYEGAPDHRGSSSKLAAAAPATGQALALVVSADIPDLAHPGSHGCARSHSTPSSSTSACSGLTWCRRILVPEAGAQPTRPPRSASPVACFPPERGSNKLGSHDPRSATRVPFGAT